MSGAYRVSIADRHASVFPDTETNAEDNQKDLMQKESVDKLSQSMQEGCEENK